MKLRIFAAADNRAILAFDCADVKVEKGRQTLRLKKFLDYPALLLDFVDVYFYPLSAEKLRILSAWWEESADLEVSWSTAKHAEVDDCYKAIKSQETLSDQLKEKLYQRTQAENAGDTYSTAQVTADSLASSSSFSNEHSELMSQSTKSSPSLPRACQKCDIQTIPELCDALRQITQDIEALETRLAKLTAEEYAGVLPAYSTTEWPNLELWYKSEVKCKQHEVCVYVASEVDQKVNARISTLWSGVTWEQRVCCTFSPLISPTCHVDVFYEFVQKTGLEWKDCMVLCFDRPWMRDHRGLDGSLVEIVQFYVQGNFRPHLTHREQFLTEHHPAQLIEYYTESIEGIAVALVLTPTNGHVLIHPGIPKMQVRIDNRFVGTFQPTIKNQRLVIEFLYIEPTIKVSRLDQGLENPKITFLTKDFATVAQSTKIHILNHPCQLSAWARQRLQGKEGAEYPLELKEVDDVVRAMMVDDDPHHFSYCIDVKEFTEVTLTELPI